VAKPRYVWPTKILAELARALKSVQAHTEAPVSLMSPTLAPDEHELRPDTYRNTVFFWLPDANCGVVWQADQCRYVADDLAGKIASHLSYAAWRSQNPDRDCIECLKPFLPAQGWEEAGYPRDVCPMCIGRRLALLGPDQVLGTPYDPRAIFQRIPAESSIDDLDGPIDSLG